MTQETFIEYIAENIEKYLPEAYTDSLICTRPIVHTNGEEYMGLVIFPAGAPMGLQVFLDPLLREFSAGRTMEDIMVDIAERIVRYKPAVMSPQMEVTKAPAEALT